MHNYYIQLQYVFYLMLNDYLRVISLQLVCYQTIYYGPRHQYVHYGIYEAMV